MSSSHPGLLVRGLHHLRAFCGIERNTTSHTEKLVSALGAALGILLVCGGMQWFFPLGFMQTPVQLLIVTSMGASAVLLFAVPQGALSQPWPVLGGHLLSALIGVSCYWLLPEHFLTPALAVGLAVGAMYYSRSIHPPGGATALAAVLGGPEIHQLGYAYLLAPVLANVLLILVAALLFNACFPWRRYPAHLNQLTRHAAINSAKPAAAAQQYELTQEDFSAAMQALDSYVDINHEQLSQLLELAMAHAEKNIVHPEHILAGHYYSNGKLGKHWGLRQVMADAAPNAKALQYRVVAGSGVGTQGQCSSAEFRQWARYEVAPEANGHWRKMSSH